jgi:Ribonucleotide reductase, small chain
MQCVLQHELCATTSTQKLAPLISRDWQEECSLPACQHIGSPWCITCSSTDAVVLFALQRDHLLRAIQTVPCIAEKASWAFKWITSATSFAERLLAFACVEGVHFSGR